LPKPELERSVQILIPKMEFASLEQEAERKAATHVANMLHTPDKLEKVKSIVLT